MPALFLGAFLGGLLLGVFAMLHGVDRRSARAPFHVVVEPTATLRLPLAAAFATVFGAVGYLLTRYGALGGVPRVAIAAGAGALAATGAYVLIQRWALPSAREERVDVRYLLQGHPARVTKAIDAGEPGAIEYEVDGARHVVPALSLDGTPVGADTEVVIERVEDGLAYVESWERVEQRL